MKTKIISNLADIIFLCCLAYCIYQPESGFTNIAMASAWVMILLGVILAFVGMLHSAAAHSIGLEKRNEMIESLVKAFGVKKRSAFVRAFSFVQVILIIAAISYVGWVFTAVAYTFTVLALQIAKSSVRDAAEKYERSLSQQKKGGDGLYPINAECKR